MHCQDLEVEIRRAEEGLASQLALQASDTQESPAETRERVRKQIEIAVAEWSQTPPSCVNLWEKFSRMADQFPPDKYSDAGDRIFGVFDATLNYLRNLRQFARKLRRDRHWVDGLAKLDERIKELKQMRKKIHAAWPAEPLASASMATVLRGPNRDTILATASAMSIEQKKALFPEWVHLARASHGPFQAAWDIIESLPRDWVLRHIDKEVDAILKDEEETDFWMFLQLYARLDDALLRELARRAATHADADIRELGQEALDDSAAAMA